MEFEEFLNKKVELYPKREYSEKKEISWNDILLNIDNKEDYNIYLDSLHSLYYEEGFTYFSLIYNFHLMQLSGKVELELSDTSRDAYYLSVMNKKVQEELSNVLENKDIFYNELLPKAKKSLEENENKYIKYCLLFMEE